MDTQKLVFLFSDLGQLSSCKEGSPVFLDDGRSGILLIVALGRPILSSYFHLGKGQTPDDSLSSSLQFLDDPDGSLHIGVQGDSIRHLLYFLGDPDFLLDTLDHFVPLARLVVVSWQRKGQSFGCKFEVHEDIVKIDIVDLWIFCVGGISDDVLFDLTHPHNHIIQHFLHEDSLLRVDHLVVRIL